VEKGRGRWGLEPPPLQISGCLKQLNDHDSWFNGRYLAGFSVEMILIGQTVLFILIFVRPLGVM